MSKEIFYTFSSKLSSSTIQAHPISLSNIEDCNGLFPQHRLIQGVYNGIRFPVIFKQEYGNKLEDVLDTGWPGLFLISSKFQNVLKDNNLSGWKTFDIIVLDKANQELQGFHGLSIIGKCGSLDFSTSEIIEKRLVVNGPLGKYYKGLPIGLDEWDGSDFFLPQKYFGTIISSKAVKALKTSKITNISLQNLADIEIPDFALKKYIK